jgi:hypothetical protein
VNNFGQDGADLDMCLLLPSGADVSSEDRPAAIEKLGAALESVGMREVKIRSTARIPIVQFIDKESGYECDISFSNPLAMSNTQLLRTYSEIDPRIRPLAYIIKHWAKARHINNPGEGTLSSYGYIICLLHFLQTRPVPLLPNLQRLPPDWMGETLSKNDHFKEENEFEINPVDDSPCKTYFYKPGIYIYIYIHTYIYIYICIYTYSYVYMYMHIYVFSWVECFGYLLLGCSVLSLSFIVCMWILLLMPLADLQFCVGSGFATPSPRCDIF